MYRAIITAICFVLLAHASLLAGNEKFNARLTATQMAAGTTSFGVEDDKFATMLISQPIHPSGPQLTFKQLGGVAFVTVGIDHEDMNYVSTAFQYTYNLDIDYYDDYSYLHTVSASLNIEYDPNGSYIDKSYFELPSNAHYITVHVNNVNITGTTTLVALNTLPTNIYLEAEIDIDRCYQFDYNSVPTFTQHSINNENDLELAWTVVNGAEAYDLEWTYIDDYDYDYVNNPGLPLTFNNNATRVTIADNKYKIPLLYEKGYVLYRVRAVGKQWDDPSQVENGYWSRSDGSFDVIAATDKTAVSPLDDDKNWQMQSTYAEEGKKKDVVTFFDGSLHNRQIVTKTNTDNNVIVGETIYDYQGRPAVQVLPVPVVGLLYKKIQYYNDFNIADISTPHTYTKQDFDKDVSQGSCTSTTAAMATTSGASEYYSVDNPEQDGFQKYVPRAFGYPFSQTEYMPDNTGRVKNQSGVGEEHKIGTGHETKYLYGQPTQEELYELFGSEAGDASHYKKNVVIDPNGQISTSYINLAGKVVASSIAGETPDNVEALEECPGPAECGTATVTRDLLGLNSNGISNGNKVDADGSSLVFSYGLLVTEKSNYTFNYDMTGANFHDDCMKDGNGDDWCFECKYKMQIIIQDECGNNINPSPDPVSIGSINSDLCSGMTAPTFTMSPIELLDLDVGNYNITKILSIDNDAMDQYATDYLDPDNNNCYKTESEWISEAQANADVSGCNMDCATCESSLTSRHSEFIANGGTEDEYQAALQECAKLCENPSPCEMGYNMMLSDLKPGGQYATYVVDNTTGVYSSGDPLSIFNDQGLLFFHNPASITGALWKTPITPYLDEDGNQSEIVVVPYPDPVNSGGTLYSPAVQASQVGHIHPNSIGQQVVAPQYLELRDFIEYYSRNPQWATSLAPYHPEYCYYQWCKQNTTSDAYDNDILNADYSTAQTMCTGDIATNLLANDPYFHGGQGTTSDLSDMTAMIAHYPTGVANTNDFSLWQVAALSDPSATACVNASDPHACLDLIFTGTGSNRYITSGTWKTVATLYYALKQKVMQKDAEEYTKTGCSMVYTTNTYALEYQSNFCIGEEPEKIVPLLVASYIDQDNTIGSGGYWLQALSEPCGWFTWLQYVHKVKRFPNRNSFGYDTDNDDQQSVLDDMKEKLDYQYFSYTGRCPITRDLENLLEALRKTGDISHSSVDLTTYSEFSTDLYNAISGASGTSASACTWSGVLSNSDKTLTVSIASTPNQCDHLSLSFGSTSSFDFTSSRIASFSNLYFTGQNSSGYYTFQLTANINPLVLTDPITHEILTGETCINIGDCHFDPPCPLNLVAVNFNMLLNALANGSELTTSSGFDLDQPPTSNGQNHFKTLSDVIIALLNNPSNTNWYWSVNASTPGEFYIGTTATPATSPTTDPYVHITFTNAPTGFDFSQIKSFSDMQAITGTGTDNFSIVATDGSNVSTTLTGIIEIVDPSTSPSTPILLSDCGLSDQPLCQTPENKNREKLESVLNGILVNHGFETGSSAINLAGIPDFADLQQYFTGSPQWDNVAISSDGLSLTANFGGLSCPFYIEFANSSPSFTFAAVGGQSPIVSFSSLRAANSLAGGNGSTEFTVLAKNADGFEELLRGHSCVKVANCVPCDDVSYKRANHWEFGHYGGLDFSNGSPIPVLSALQTLEGVSSISDDNGNLLFYTDGINVYDKRDLPMYRATGVASDDLKGNEFSTQSALIMQDPANQNLYYIFTADGGDYSNYDGVFYSKVDITQNSGLGAIVELNTRLTPTVSGTPELFAEKLTAVMSGNNKDFWVLVHKMNSNDFYSYFVDENGVNTTPVVSSVGSSYTLDVNDNTTWYSAKGYLKASIDGTKLAAAIMSQDLVEVFHFDKTSGEVSDVIHATLPEATYGVEFSPDGNFLYTSSATQDEITGGHPRGAPGYARVRQFPLTTWSSTNFTAGGIDVMESEENTGSGTSITIGSLVVATGGLHVVGALQIGPDYKIYGASGKKLDVIATPNIQGYGCGYLFDELLLSNAQQSSTTLNTALTSGSGLSISAGLGLPNIVLNGCSSPPTELPDYPAPAYTDPCATYVNLIAEMNGRNAFNQQNEQLTRDFKANYKSACLKTLEELSATFDQKESHYTLYYYDQAGNLVRTVPPKGVEKVDVTSSATLSQIVGDRTNNTQTYYTQHTMPTTYTYNSLNQLVGQSVPDNDLIDDNRSLNLSTNSFPSGLDITGIQYTNGTNGFLTGNINGKGVLYETNDGGLTWHVKSNLDNRDLLGVCMYDNIGDGFAVGKQGAVLGTTNDGNSWSVINTGTNNNLNTVFFKDADHGVIAGDNGVVYTTNSFGTNHALTLNTSTSGIGDIKEMVFNDPANISGYAVVNSGSTGKIYHITGTGTIWTQINNIKANDINDAQFTYNASGNFSGGYAVGTNGLVMSLASAAGQSYWNVLPPPSTEKLLQVHFDPQSGEGIVMSEGNVYLTNDGGHTWSQPAFSNATSPVTFVGMAFTDATNGLLLNSAGTLFSINLNNIGNGPLAILSTTGGTPSNGLPSSGLKSIYAYYNSAQTSADVFVLADNSLYKLGTTSGVFSPISSGANMPTGCEIGDFTGYGQFDYLLVAQGELYHNDLTSLTPNFVLATDINGGTLLNTGEHVAALASSGTAHYAATSQGRLLISDPSTNGGSPPGAKWQEVVPGTTPLSDLGGNISLSVVNGVNAVPNIYAAGGDGNVRFSNNGGQSWSDLNNVHPGKLHSIAFDQSSGLTGLVVGEGGKIYQTTDGGSTWQMLNNETTTKTLHGVSVYDANNWLAVGDAGTMLYPSSGVPTQASSTNSSIDYYSATLLASNLGIVVGKNGEFGSYGLGNYSAATPNVTQENLNHVIGVFDNYGTWVNYVAVGNSGTIINAGAHGPQVTSSLSYNDELNTTFMINAQAGYAAGNNKLIIKTIDGGGTWTDATPTSGVTSMDIHGIYFSSSNNGFFVGTNGRVYHSNGTTISDAGNTGSSGTLFDVWTDLTKAVAVGADGVFTNTYSAGAWGSSWSPSTSSPTNITGVAVVNGTVWVCGSGGKIYKGTDVWTGTPTWTLQSIAYVGSTPNFTDIYFSDANTGWAIADDGSMYSTIDGGVNPWGLVDLSSLGVSSGTLTHFTFNAQGQAMVAGTSSGAPMVFNLQDEDNLYSSKFWYDRLGRLVASQNSKQKKTNAYSFTLYDALGRITKVGQVVPVGSINQTRNSLGQIDETLFGAWVSGGYRTEVVQTWYDEQKFANLPITQENLRNRVASVTYEDVDDNDDNTFATATHYSYDIHGNVKTALQDVPSLGNAEYMRLDYDYDLISGKVNEVVANKGREDQFFHKYEYDADNRITNVWTSKDGIIWDQDAKYFYYAHGPLARVELGDDKVQAVDYAYTIQGWVKGVNSNALKPLNDIGKDGWADASNLDRYNGRDAYGYNLNYFDGDYKPINDNLVQNTNSANYFLADADNLSSSTIFNTPNLYNGNIKSMVTTITNNNGDAEPQYTGYKYDQLNRIKEMTAFKDFSFTDNKWNQPSPSITDPTTTDYHSKYTYDPNGNITKLTRNGLPTTDPVTGTSTTVYMDELQYHYDNTGTNQLTSVDDAINTTVTTNDYKKADFQQGQAANNYGYDEIGELKRDDQGGIANIEWSLMGKIKYLQRTSTSTDHDLAFYYNPQGERIAKLELDNTGNLLKGTVYMRDPQGNIMATYRIDPPNNIDFQLEDQYIYGSSRLGTYHRLLDMTGTITNFDRVRGQRLFELSNHLGNVLSVVSDRKVAVDDNNDGIIDYFKPYVTSAQDYYPFGMMMVQRGFNRGDNSFGFNGQEQDDEIAGNGNINTAMYWEYDTRLGRRWNLDVVKKAWASDYLVLSCNPISMIDKMGDDDYFNTDGQLIRSTKKGTQIMVVDGKQTFLLSNYLANEKYSMSQRAVTAVGIANNYAPRANVQGRVGAELLFSDPKSPAFTQAGKVSINLAYNKKRYSLYNNYNSLINTLVHEADHQKKGDVRTYAEHAEIYLDEIKDPSFAKADQEYQRSQVGSFANHILNSKEQDPQEYESEQLLKEFNKVSKDYYLTETYNEYHEVKIDVYERKTGKMFSVEMQKLSEPGK